MVQYNQILDAKTMKAHSYVNFALNFLSLPKTPINGILTSQSILMPSN